MLAFATQVQSQYIDHQPLVIPSGNEPFGTSQLINVETTRPVVAANIRLNPEQDLTGAYLIAGLDTFLLSLDEDNEPGEPLFSSPVLFPAPVSRISLFPGALTGQAELLLVPAEHAILPESRYPHPVDLTGNIGLPPMIDQQVWRAGLPSPNYERIHNQVRNVIIHHTASSNQVTDYTTAIRSIYLLHTQTRGWSDIGYNYLVAPNGVIYKGRDPGPYQQDEVLGAHFCASNTGTLGISILGDYQNTPPPGLALHAIERLIAWKLQKDHLDPLGITPHPLNPTLHVISGHRDGCATLCPGDQLYAMLPGLRNRVHQLIIHTGIDLTDHPSTNEPTLMIFPNPVRDFLTIESDQPIRYLRILNSTGNLIWHLTGQPTQLDVTNWISGWYIIQVYADNAVTSKKILKIK